MLIEHEQQQQIVTQPVEVNNFQMVYEIDEQLEFIDAEKNEF